jgi:hypothetical protein
MLANRGKLKALQQFKHSPPGVYDRIVSTLISPKEQKNPVVSHQTRNSRSSDSSQSLYLSPFVNNLTKGEERREEVRTGPSEITLHHWSQRHPPQP